MILHADPDSPVPPYEQIRIQVATMIATGVLPAGRRLPTIRQLATDLGLAGGTVARAYRELEQASLIVSRGRHGSFVAERPSAPTREREQALVAAARVFAAQAAQAGVDPRSVLDVALEAFRSHPEPAV